MLAELILIAELLERSGGVSPAAQQPKPKPIAKKITISIGTTPLLLPEGFELVGPSRLGLRPKGL